MHLIYSRRVARHMSRPYSHCHQALLSMSYVTFLLAVLMHLRDSGNIVGSGGTWTLSLMNSHKKKSHTVGSADRVTMCRREVVRACCTIILVIKWHFNYLERSKGTITGYGDLRIPTLSSSWNVTAPKWTCFVLFPEDACLIHCSSRTTMSRCTWTYWKTD